MASYLRRTKIVATVGPASASAEMIAKLLDAGVNVFRMNFSHGSAEGHRQQAKIIRQVAEEKHRNAAILGDLQGPKIRIGDLVADTIELVNDSEITLTIDDNKPKSTTCIGVGYKALPQFVTAGDTLLLDDGLLRLEVLTVDATDVRCRVIEGGILKPRKGLNRLGGGLSAPTITEKDYQDLQLAIELELDYLAVSFPSCAADLQPVRDALNAAGVATGIIAKIERAEAVATDEVLRALIDASDGVMVARGDLGVEIGDPQLIGTQKKIIHFARKANKPVITATQMMESMINQPVPTRAEVFDVANAVLDGTDAVMLSAETAAGKFPVQVVKAMAATCVGAEQHPDVRISGHRMDQIFSGIDETVALSAIYAANHLHNVGAIICLTESGRTALIMSRLSSGLPIYALSRHRVTCRKMALYRGVKSIHFDVTAHGDDIYAVALQTVAEQQDALDPGQSVVITCGDISGSGGQTNHMKILQWLPERD
ncbi:pyruvate kinase [Halioxenophilus sp. WMMB6]|uniref:pyruvate kinase n=1 Tax=Halioxenophilus sp. WMMB6 TaxID=3073815 RepID=UPI00295E74AD|nr:pyruvate kinase [Halioxenophilus sp. WMMB6]